MRATWCVLLLSAWLGRAAMAQQPAVTFDGQKTLEELAEELFGDALAAAEIRALNGLDGGAQPAAGTRLRLPGPERDAALTALKMAAQALAQAEAAGAREAAGKKYQAASESLQRSRAALQGARYGECRKLADEAWAQARQAARQSQEQVARTSRFAVSVDDKGNTTVGVIEGEGVKVTAGKHSATVSPGEVVRVRPEATPAPPRRLLSAPRQLLPNEGSLVVTRSIFFRWEPVAGAIRYVLLLAGDDAGRRPVRQVTCEGMNFLLRSSLPDGEYFWMLRSVDADGMVGPVSPARRLVLQEAPDGGVSVNSSGEAGGP